MPREKGSSLLEVIIVVSISALLATASATFFTRTIHQYRIDYACRDFIQTLALARSEAVKRNVRVTIKNQSQRWEDGWIMFADADNDADLDSDEFIIQHRKSSNEWLTLRGNTTVKSFISYSPEGFTIQLSGTWQAGTLTLCPLKPDSTGYKIIINRGGRAYSKKISEEDCTAS